MFTKIFGLFALLLGSVVCFAQPTPQPILYISFDPTGLTCARTSIALRTPNGILYSCQNGTYAAATGGGGGGTGSAAETIAVTYGATPTFTAVSNTVTVFTMTLTGNVTSCTLAGMTSGQSVTFRLTQDGTGGRTFACTGLTGLATIDTTASRACTQTFAATSSSAATAVGPMECPTSDALSLIAPSGGATINFPTGTNTMFGSSADNTGTGAQVFNGASRTAPSKSGTSLPGTCTVADTYIKTDATNTNVLYVCTATNTWTAQGGGGSSFDPGTMSYIEDEFASQYNYLSAPFGSQQWNSYGGASPTIAMVAGVANHPGIINMATNGGGNFDAVFYNIGGVAAQGPVIPADTFNVLWILRWNSGADTNVSYQVGLGAGAVTAQVTDGIYFNKATAATNWTGTCRASSTSTDTSTVAAVGTGWAVMNFYRKDASTIGFKIASTVAGLTGASEQTCTTNIPTAALYPYLRILNNSSASRNVDIDYWRQSISGITR